MEMDRRVVGGTYTSIKVGGFRTGAELEDKTNNRSFEPTLLTSVAILAGWQRAHPGQKQVRRN
jgi:hypothetical protein